MRILGIDPGFGRCGYAVLEKTTNDWELVSFGTIVTEPTAVFADRLTELGEDLSHLLQKFSPDMVSVEDLFFVQNVTTGINVAQARGVILFLARQFGCQVVEPKPVELKKSFTGNGKASKTEMKKMAHIMFDLQDSPQIDDAADAIAAAVWGQSQVMIDNS